MKGILRLTLYYIIVFNFKAMAVNLNLLTHSHSPIYLLTEDTLTKDSLQKNSFIFSTYYSYIKNPLISTSPDKNTQTGTIIEQMSNLNIGLGYQSSQRFLIGVSTFISEIDYGQTKEQSLGDTKLSFKYRLTGNNNINSFALIQENELPTGSEQKYTGQGGYGAGLKLAYERDFYFFKINTNLGYLRNTSARLRDLDYSDKILASLGVHYPYNDKLSHLLEVQTIRTLPFNSNQNPGELYIGSKYNYTKYLSLNAGLSLGFMDKYDSNEYKLLLGLKYHPKRSRPYYDTLSKEQKDIVKEILSIDDEILFSHDSSVIDDRAKQALIKIAGLIKEARFDFTKVTIRGHANHIGTSEYNRNLSQKRAENVKKFLQEHGVEINILETMGLGEEELKLIGNQYQKDLSRRVEFRVLK